MNNNPQPRLVTTETHTVKRTEYAVKTATHKGEPRKKVKTTTLKPPKKTKTPTAKSVKTNKSRK
jgi:hypothetical protein